jgi:hypothetical protein
MAVIQDERRLAAPRAALSIRRFTHERTHEPARGRSMDTRG